jgi:hypothetical protein
MRQFGTPQSDSAYWLFVDGRGHINLSGSTAGSLGAPNAGNSDAWVATYNSSGDRLWLEQFGTPAQDDALGVSADANGNVYISGTTGGNLGGTHFGSVDAFIVKYNARGAQLWSRQLGTSKPDYGQRNSVDDVGNVYIAGSTLGELAGSPTIPENGFLAKYDSLGNRVWVRQREEGLGSSGYQGVVADPTGHIYVSGTGDGMARFHGGITSKYDQDGNLSWTGHVESDEAPAFGRDVSSDGMGNVYLVGTAATDLEAYLQGDNDALLAKFDDSGTLLWTRQLATNGYDEASTVFADGLGNVYIAGYLERTRQVRPSDAFVAKYNGAGDLLWMHRVATDAAINSVATDGLGNLYVAGRLGGDAFLAKFIEQPAVPGDYDANGIVDVADHSVWKAVFGSTTEMGADGNRNGVIDAADYVVWRNNLASTSPAAGANAALIPEPATILLLATVLALAGGHRELSRRR